MTAKDEARGQLITMVASLTPESSSAPALKAKLLRVAELAFDLGWVAHEQDEKSRTSSEGRPYSPPS